MLAELQDACELKSKLMFMYDNGIRDDEETLDELNDVIAAIEELESALEDLNA